MNSSNKKRQGNVIKKELFASFASNSINQYEEWCEKLKIELKHKSEVNVEQRIEKVENIVNSVVKKELQRHFQFCILDDDKNNIMSSIEHQIHLWNGVEIEVCKNKEKKSFVAYQSTARNWFNRNKAKIYGSYLFYPLIFIYTLKFCYELNDISDSKKMTIFLDIFERVLNEPVQFPRTKLQPLIPHQSLMQPNEFKKACKSFTSHYGITWPLNNNSTNDQNKRDRDRAKKIHRAFTDCLAKIKNILQTPQISFPFPFEQIISPNTNATRKNKLNLVNDISGNSTAGSISTNSTFQECNTIDLPPNVPYANNNDWNEEISFDCNNTNVLGGFNQNNSIHFNNEYQIQNNENNTYNMTENNPFCAVDGFENNRLSAVQVANFHQPQQQYNQTHVRINTLNLYQQQQQQQQQSQQQSQQQYAQSNYILAMPPSDNDIISYTPTRGPSTSVVSRRYSPMSTPSNSNGENEYNNNLPQYTNINEQNYNNYTITNSNNDTNRLHIDQYNFPPFSPSNANLNHVNNTNNNSFPFFFENTNIANNPMEDINMTIPTNDVNNNNTNNMNEGLVFTSQYMQNNLSSPTPMYGGFL